MAEEALKIGDTVQLKSGGPIMTIRSIRGQEALCQWFAGSESKSAAFGLLSLKKYEEPEEDLD